MTNRQRVIAAIKAHHSEKLHEEVAYYTETYCETEGYDYADALHDALNFAEHSGDKALARVCVDVLILAGFYEPRRDEVVTMGRDRAPIRNGIRYDAATSWHEWING